MEIPHPIASAARARPNHPALIGRNGEVITYADLLDLVKRRATAFSTKHLAATNRVAVVVPDARTIFSFDAWVSFISTFHAISWAKKAAVLLPPALDDDARLKACTLAKALPAWSQPTTDAPQFAAASDTASDEPFWGLDDTIAVVFTSGTTGIPRPVPVTWGQVVMGAFGSAIRLGHDPSDTWMLCLSPHHVGGLSVLLRCAIYATSVVIALPFDAEQIAAGFQGGDVSLCSLVPTMLGDVLDVLESQEITPSPHLRAVLIGGAPCPPALIERSATAKLPIALSCGMSETAAQIATREPGDCRLNADSGPPLPFSRVGASSDGRLTVRGAATPVTIANLGDEFVTADHGEIDSSGRVVIYGRADRVLISGGELVSPQAIERCLLSHFAVSEAAVVAVPSERWGERPVAFVVPKNDVAICANDILDCCHKHLRRYEVPERVLVLPSLPLTDGGKIDYRSLKRLAAAN